MSNTTPIAAPPATVQSPRTRPDPATGSNPGASSDAGYAGDIAPGQAWQRVQSGEAALVDVRTAEELHWVGRVPGAGHVEWAIGREQRLNGHFIEQLAARVPKDRPVLFLCRSGIRSAHAARAASQAGWTSAWNVLQGFEGPIDPQRQRGRIGGWRAAGLPWQQN